MRSYDLDLRDDYKNIYSGHIKLGGTNPKGDKLTVTNYYMEMNGEPFFGISGEFHYSRYDARYWEEEIVKMKMCGIKIIATYIFWNHHEEVQGIFEWEGNKNLRRFIELCGKHHMYVIIRIGPFDHGEVRNGGVPDWMYGRPFELRSNDPEYLYFVDKLYKEIGEQVKGFMFKDGGPIIGAQIENEYMHAAAPWEMTTGISNEWLPGGSDGEAHMKKLKAMAKGHGIDTPIYTCTAWGGAATPLDEMLPLWGGYAFWPWIFYGDVKEHPATPEYLFRDYHNNEKPKCYNYDPSYEPESYPYSCCEMGGGMTVFYKYRFIFPPESVAAMSGIKVAGGCNFIGYYMFHGGSNPKGKVNPYLNELATPKISYDYQAVLGEYGQVRKSYKDLKVMHYFLKDFEKIVCPMKPIIPQEAGGIDPLDVETLRYAARVKNDSGFIFINNYQDHTETKEQKDFSINLDLKEEKLSVPYKNGLSLGKDSHCILPFNFKMGEIKLKYASAQLITVKEYDNETYYFFFTPEGMTGEYCFAEDGIESIEIDNGNVERYQHVYLVNLKKNSSTNIKITTVKGETINVCTLTKKQSENFWKVDLEGKERIVITNANLIPLDGEIRLETTGITNVNFEVFPPLKTKPYIEGAKVTEKGLSEGLFDSYEFIIAEKIINLEVKNVKKDKAVIKFAGEEFSNVKDVMLKIDYIGDIGYAFIDGELINDNFCNGDTWELALKRFEKALLHKGMYVHISPIKKGSVVSSDSTMAARTENSKEEIAEISSIKAVPIYQVILKNI